MRPLGWGAKVSPEFCNRVRQIADKLGTEPDFLMACMSFESGRTFDPSVKNMAGSGAVGLIQFMPSTAKELGTTTFELSVMSSVGQLDYVEKYMMRFKNRLMTLSDCYMAILWPAAVGKPEDYVLFYNVDFPKPEDVTDQMWQRLLRSPKRYRQNKGLDIDKNGKITKAEAASKLNKILAEGRLPKNLEKING